MAKPSILQRAWLAVSKPREPLVPKLVRRYKRKQFARLPPDATRDDRYYDLAIREYLAIWRESKGLAELYVTAANRLGLDESDADFVMQVLCSAAYGTLPNWANSHDDPWFQAAWRFSQSFDRHVLRQLYWEISP